MGELVIKCHNFENAKNKIKKFSEETGTVLELKKVAKTEDILWGLFGFVTDHKVTGDELNKLTGAIQEHLKDINTTQIKLIQEFGQVYNALEALDNDYIQAILISIKATEVTSQGIANTQKEIAQIVDDQKKTLEVLKKFKQKLDNYSHLGDIDKIWSDCQKWCMEINALSTSIEGATESITESAKKVDAVRVALTEAEKRINDLSKEFNQLIQRLEPVIAFTSAMEEIVHLQDVDAIWSRSEDQQLRLKELESAREEHTSKLNALAQKDDSLLESIDTTKGDIKFLNEYKAKLSKLSHLEDIDGVWATVEKQSAQLSALESQNGDIISAVENNKQSADMALANAIEHSNATAEILAKKVKYAYLIAGGSAGLAIIELIVILMQVI